MECIQIVASALPYLQPGARLNWRWRNDEDSGSCRVAFGRGRRVGGRAAGAETTRQGYSGRSTSPQRDVPDLVARRPRSSAAGSYGLCGRCEELPGQRPRDIRGHRRVEDKAEDGCRRDHVDEEVGADDERTCREKVGSANQSAGSSSQAATLKLFPASLRLESVSANSGGLVRPPLRTSAAS